MAAHVQVGTVEVEGVGAGTSEGVAVAVLQGKIGSQVVSSCNW